MNKNLWALTPETTITLKLLKQLQKQLYSFGLSYTLINIIWRMAISYNC